MQLFEAAGPAPAFGFGGIGAHMQFGPVAAAFGQQQQQFGVGGGVDWSSPAPSPPPIVGAGGLAPAAVFGAHAGMPFGHPMQPGGYGGKPVGMPHRPLPQQLEDPAAALPDDVFDAPPPQYQHQQAPPGLPNGQQRGRGYIGRGGRPRGPRYPQQQHPPQQNGGYAQQHAGYPAAGAGFPPQMPGW